MVKTVLYRVRHGRSLTFSGGALFEKGSRINILNGNVSIGDNRAFGPHVMVYDRDHKFGYNGIENRYNMAPVEIERNYWIGAGTIILRGTHIGEGCVIGVGCVVKGDIPAHSLVKANRSLEIVPIETPM